MLSVKQTKIPSTYSKNSELGNKLLHIPDVCKITLEVDGCTVTTCGIMKPLHNEYALGYLDALERMISRPFSLGPGN